MGNQGRSSEGDGPQIKRRDQSCKELEEKQSGRGGSRDQVLRQEGLKPGRNRKVSVAGREWAWGCVMLEEGRGQAVGLFRSG